jgi:Fur family iron response transcriptional regulator
MNSIRSQSLQQRLAGAGIVPTLQRMAVAHVMLVAPVHMTAEQVLDAAHDYLPGLSRATVYAALRLFVQHGLLRELPIDGAATVFDSNPSPHHHLYDVDTGEVADVPLAGLQVQGLDSALHGLDLVGVDVVVRVHGLSQRMAASAAR